MSILQMNISACILITAVIVIRAVALNRLPKTMLLVLWGIVMLRLLIPVSVPSQFSIYNFIDGIFHEESSAVESSDSIDEKIISYVNIKGENIPQIIQEQGSGFAPAAVIWIIGMSAVFIIFSVIYFKNHKALRYACIIRDNDFLNQWLAENKMMRKVTIFRSDTFTTPVAVGIFRPRIILPASMNMDNKDILLYVLTHEYYHIKRCDTFWKLLSSFVVCIYWFNPIVWVMLILINRDLELTCDEMVIRHFGAKTKTAYAYALIAMAEQKNKFTPLYNGFSKNAAEERIVSIMKFKKTKLTAVILSALLIAATTIVFASNAKNTDINDEITNNSEAGFSEIEDTTDIVEDEVSIPETESQVSDEPVEEITDIDISEAADNNDDEPGMYVFDLDGKPHRVESSYIKILTYDEYVEWLENYKIEYADASFELTDGNGDKSIWTIEQMIEIYESKLEEIKAGTKEFKLIIVDGVVLAWGDWESI